MLRAFNLIFAAATFIIGFSSAHAATITYSTPQLTTFVGNPNLSPSFLPQFDPALGTLTGVTYHETGGGFTFSWQNTSSSDILGRVAMSVGLTLSAPGITYADHDYRPDYTAAGGTGCCFGQLITPGTHTSSTTAPIDFTIQPSGDVSSLIGTGTFSANVFWSEDSDTCDNYNDHDNSLHLLVCSRSGAANLTTSVTYTYDPASPPPPSNVPEPASAALLVAGIGAAYVRRRRS